MADISPDNNVAANQSRRNGIAIVGTVGVPGRYGGFETLAENIVHYHSRHDRTEPLAVYCSLRDGSQARPDRFQSATLRYVALDANGPQSIAYDMVSLFDCVRRRDGHILILGVSGTIALPIVRLISNARITTNIDGIEWKRAKWTGVARLILKISEWFAVRFSHNVVADNQAIADYVHDRYKQPCTVIAYGGDHALEFPPDPDLALSLPDKYALALCRIEPENNAHLILEAWQRVPLPLVFVGNWENSAYGRDLKARFVGLPGIHLVDPVYDPGVLRAIRERATVYIHGHSAGGTNPSLVEMMHFGIPVVAHGCQFNRFTTDDRALYFETSDDIVDAMSRIVDEASSAIGPAMRALARERYMWDRIGEQYFELLSS